MNHVTTTRRFILATFAVVSVAACHHRSGGSATAPSAPDETVRQFLAAVNAQDLDKMAALWGTESGPVAQSNASSADVRHQRLSIMQHLLQADSFRVQSIEAVPGHETHRRIEVELMRADRRATVPFILVPARTGGWLVSEIDLNSAMPLSARGVSN